MVSNWDTHFLVTGISVLLVGQSAVSQDIERLCGPHDGPHCSLRTTEAKPYRGPDR